jgi:hypothetical protein
MCHLSLLVLFVKLFDFSSVLQNITNVSTHNSFVVGLPDYASAHTNR